MIARLPHWIRWLALVVLLGGATGFGRETKALAPLRILFVGNSYTYFNSMPELVAAVGRHDRGAPRIEVAVISGPGLTLSQHVQHGRVQAEIRRGKWDYVVLQEQSLLGMPVSPDEFADPSQGSPTAFLDAVGALSRAAKQAGATPVLFNTWARRERPQTQAFLDASYVQAAQRHGAKLVPVGTAWQLASAQGVDGLFEPDGSHPSAVGSYLVASAMYRTLVGREPKPAPTRLASPRLSSTGKPLQQRDRVEVPAKTSRQIWRGVVESLKRCRERFGTLCQPGA
ncbi:MAG: SGNH/GDSL hydrolase family protein [Myxococcales bacterium FL481]|nr:MAG: SGNH/GDSL hydrolase family protein [Myxococcales bacterium FL481]